MDLAPGQGAKREKAGGWHGKPRAGLNAHNGLWDGTKGYGSAMAKVRPIKRARHAARSVERPAAVQPG